MYFSLSVWSIVLVYARIEWPCMYSLHGLALSQENEIHGDTTFKLRTLIYSLYAHTVNDSSSLCD